MRVLYLFIKSLKRNETLHKFLHLEYLKGDVKVVLFYRLNAIIFVSSFRMYCF